MLFKRGLSVTGIILAAVALGLVFFTRAVSSDRGSSDAGVLDFSFGESGRVVTALVSGDLRATAGIRSLVLQEDGKIVAAGSAALKTFNLGSSNREDTHLALARYDSQGRLDPAFGTEGIVITGVGTRAWAVAAAIQKDGKLLAAGPLEGEVIHVDPHFGELRGMDFVLLRYESDGTVDAAFGSGGKVTVNLGGVDVPHALAIQADGKIVVAGRGSFGRSPSHFALVRFDADGGLDQSFGEGGIVRELFRGNGAAAKALLILPSGELIVAGHAYVGRSNDFAMLRYQSDGVLDETFGDHGIATINIREEVHELPSSGLLTLFSDDSIEAVAVQPDGKIIAAGTSGVGEGFKTFTLARFLADGTLDDSFGTNGLVVTQLGKKGLLPSMTVQPDGRIVLGAHEYAGGDMGFLLARFNADGSLDHSFGRRGTVTTYFPGYQSAGVTTLRIQSDGKILAAGSTGDSSGHNFALARYLPH